MMNYNDIIEIEEVVNTFSQVRKTAIKQYLVKSIGMNEIVGEDIDDPRNRKSIHRSKILTINGMTVARNAKV